MGFICPVFDRRYLRETSPFFFLLLRLIVLRDIGYKTLDVESSNEQFGTLRSAADIFPSKVTLSSARRSSLL